jgi:hypothetical protein
MPIPVSVHHVAEELSTTLDQVPVYLNRKTGEFFAWNEDWSFPEDKEDLSSYPAWQQEAIVRYREVCNSDDWVALPAPFDLDEWSMMRGFCEDVASDRKREALLDSIRGRGAFRRFKDTAASLGLIEQWYVYRDKAFYQLAVEWLEENKIPYTTESRTRSTGEAV